MRVNDKPADDGYLYTYFKKRFKKRRMAVVERKLYDRKEMWFPYLVWKKKRVLRVAQNRYCRTNGQLAPA